MESFRKVSNQLQSPLNTPGATPLRPPELGVGAGAAATVVLTDMVVGGSRGCVPCKVAVVSKLAMIVSIIGSVCWGSSGGSMTSMLIGGAASVVHSTGIW